MSELIAGQENTGADLSEAEQLRDVLMLYGERAGAVRNQVQSQIVPAPEPMTGETWELTFKHAPHPDIDWQHGTIDLRRKDPRDHTEPDPESLIKAIEQATGIPRSE